MSVLGHVAVGAAAARLADRRISAWPPLRLALPLFVGLSILPDIDFLFPAAGLATSPPWSHRGATHSLFVAAVVGITVGLVVGRKHPRPARAALAILCAGVMASHGLLDAFSAGGHGPMLLWPISSEWILAEWHPLPVPPLGPQLLTAGGLRVALMELVLFTPLWLIAFWPRRSLPEGNRTAAG